MNADTIFDLLVSHAGASEFNREEFRYWMKERKGYEFRFGGNLGSGGKFWRNAGRLYVSCYPEDLTPKREEIIEKVNFELKKYARPCGNPECSASSGIHEGLTFGSGKLDESGYWEFPCNPCARAWDAEHPNSEYGEAWPFKTSAETSL